MSELLSKDLSSANKVEHIGGTGTRETLLVEKDGVKFVIKRSEQADPYLQQELENLKNAQGIQGIPKLLAVDNNEKGGLAFAREYVEGRMLENREKITDPSKKQQLITMIQQLHSRGVSYLDLYQYNLVDDGSNIHLVDLGPWIDFEYRLPERKVQADMEKLKRIIG